MTNGIVRLEKLERVLLCLSLVVPTFFFTAYNLLVLMDDEDTNYVFLASSGKMLVVSLLCLYFLTAIVSSLWKLIKSTQLSERELVTMKLLFIIFLLVVLLVDATSSNGNLDSQDGHVSSDPPLLKTFLVFGSLVLYFSISNMHRFSGWLRARAPLITVVAVSLFILSWLFWISSFSWLENEVDQVRYDNADQWDTFGDLANDLWDANLLERELETMFPKGLGIKPVGNAVLLRVLPTNLESHTARLYFLDDRGILQADLTYGLDNRHNLDVEYVGETQLIKQTTF